MNLKSSSLSERQFLKATFFSRMEWMARGLHHDAEPALWPLSEKTRFFHSGSIHSNNICFYEEMLKKMFFGLIKCHRTSKSMCRGYFNNNPSTVNAGLTQLFWMLEIKHLIASSIVVNNIIKFVFNLYIPFWITVPALATKAWHNTFKVTTK